jgi:hypothetical protein
MARRYTAHKKPSTHPSISRRSIANRASHALVTNNAQEHSNEMGKYFLIAVALLLVIVLGGVGVLMFWDVPAPSTPVEHAIPDAKLAK